MDKNILSQKKIFEEVYDPQHISQFLFHITNDPLTRYLRDRRLLISLNYLKSIYSAQELFNWRILIVCGGVGGEGIFFRKAGFTDVTVSDFSANSLFIANYLDSSLKTLQINAESINLPDNSYELVVVQDGLHHLPRPVLGFTEMLRVASKAVVVIEPHESLVGTLIGTEWEGEGNAINYVFRWSYKMASQIVKSYLLKDFKKIKVFRFWDHNVFVRRCVKHFPSSIKLMAAQTFYRILSLINNIGNMFICIVIK